MRESSVDPNFPRPTRPALAVATLLVAACVSLLDAIGDRAVARAHTGGGGGAVVGPQYPLGSAAIAMRDGSQRRLRFRARWRGAAETIAPESTGAVLRIAGAADEGDSGIIRLPAERWRRGARTIRYHDPEGREGGIQSVVLSPRRRGGKVEIRGGADNWRYALDQPQTFVTVTLEVGTVRWCADFHREDFRRNGTGKLRAWVRTAPSSCPCGGIAASTWDGIQSMFAQHGCTQAVCHGSAPGQGGLDLRPDVAHRNLVGVGSTVLPSELRVRPGDKNESLLWRKLAASTLGLEGVPGSPMPFGDVSPLAEDELQVIAVWIQNGAPERGIVPDTERLLSACPLPPVPQKIPPPDPPAITEGVQLHGPAWSIPIESEDEVCYATYYDFSEVIAAEFRAPCPEGRGQPGAECFFYKRAELVQDPNSHHSIPRIYLGEFDVTHPAFGVFTCHGGPQAGTACNPKGLGVAAPAGAECGPGGGCAGTVTSAVACLGYGPPDFARGFDLAQSATAPYILISTEPRYVSRFPDGVVEAMPIRGTMVWNSHAFNVTSEPTTNEQWLRLFFAAPSEQRFVLEDFFDVSDIFVADVPPFEERQYCRTFTFEKGTRLFEITSHTHKRGALFRAWGPGISPPCRTSKGDVCEPEAGPPFLLTTDYSDPDQVVFDPPLALDGDDPASRTIKYCALYDNGRTDPANVKRRSTAPPGAMTCGDDELRCLDGPARGRPCHGDHSACDSRPGVGDGRCDACPVRGWVTADDEMFAVIGSYFCAEGVDCKLPTLLPDVFPSGPPPITGF